MESNNNTTNIKIEKLFLSFIRKGYISKQEIKIHIYYNSRLPITIHLYNQVETAILL